MDLLFKRYASPYFLIDQMISVGKFSEFIVEVFNMISDDEQWEFFLHKVMNQSFADFKNSLLSTANNCTKDNIETTINESYMILSRFEPTV